LKKILLIGSGGQLGQDLKLKLKHLENFYTLDRSQLDVLNFDILFKKLSSFNPEIIINCVAFTNVRNAEFNNQCFSINHLYVEKLSEFCALRNIFLIHFSTDYVFDGAKSDHT